MIYFFSLTTFADIRHPEELSLLRPIEQKKKKKEKDSNEEIYDLTEVPLSSGRLISLKDWNADFKLIGIRKKKWKMKRKIVDVMFRIFII